MAEELISKQELIKQIRLMANRTSLGEIKPAEISGLEVCGLVLDAPAVDAVEVVRCKDCKYRSGLNGRAPFMFFICTCAEGLTGAVHDNSFCSYGERKEDNAR